MPSGSANSTLTSGRSRFHLGRGTLAGLIVGCIVGSLLIGATIIYMIRKRRRGKEKKIEVPALDVTEPQDHLYDSVPHELPVERDPREIMDARRDQAELPASWTTASLVEMDAPQGFEFEYIQ